MQQRNIIIYESKYFILKKLINHIVFEFFKEKNINYIPPFILHLFNLESIYLKNTISGFN